MRLLVTLVLLFGAAGPVAAQVGGPAPIEKPKPLDELSQKEIEREMQQQKWQGPSGFWTSPHRSEHGAYRYRLMGIGAALLLGMGLVTLRLIRRANAARSTRSS